MKRSELSRRPWRRRRKAAAGRPSLAPVAYHALVAQLRERAGGRCEVCGKRGRDAHHVRKRSHGGPDSLDNLIFLCGGPRGCHDKTDAAYASASGRLVFFPFPGGGFGWEILRALDKWSPTKVVVLSGVVQRALL